MYAVSMVKPHLPENWAPSIDGKFEPNLINSVVFLVTAVQQVTVFVVNYKGLPFMSGLLDNSFLIWSLMLCGGGAFLAASNYLPDFNRMFQLVEYPSEGFQRALMALLAFDIVGTFCWDRLMLLVFAPKILVASFAGTTWKDVFKLVRIAVMVFFLLQFFTFDDETWAEIEAEMDRQKQG